MEACSAWLTAVTGSSRASRGRSRACSTAVARSPAATRTGSGSGGVMPRSIPSCTGAAARVRLAAPEDAGGRPYPGAMSAPEVPSRPGDRPPSASCWPRPAATAPVSTGPSRPSSRRSSSTARPVYVRKQIVHNLHVVETLERARRDLRRRHRRGAGGRDRRLLGARRLAGGARAEARDRQLRTIDATCPLVTKVHQEAKRFAREGFDILLVGHAGHEEVEGTAGEAPDAHPAGRGRGRRRRGHGPRPGEGRLAVADHAVGGRDHGDRAARCASGSRRCRTRRATTSATPRRTGRPRSRRWRRSATWCSSSGRATRRTRCGWSRWRWTAGAGAAHLVDYAREIDEAWLDGVRDGRRHQRRLGAGGAGARGARRTSPSAGGRASRRSRPPRRRWSSRCPASCGRLALDDAAGPAPARARRRWSTAIVGKLFTSGAADDQQRAVPARAVAHQHDGRNGEREEQGRRHAPDRTGRGGAPRSPRGRSRRSRARGTPFRRCRSAAGRRTPRGR